MIKVILLWVLISVCSSQEGEDIGDPISDWERFEKFKERFKKSYSSSADEQYHFKVFQSNLCMMRWHNEKFRQGNVTWMMGIGPFADITAEEFMKKFEGYTDPYDDMNMLEDYAIGKSGRSGAQRGKKDKIDHSSHLGGVGDQKNCNAGWAFAAAATAGAMLSKERKLEVDLSAQNLIDCAYGPIYGSSGCLGGTLLGALKYLQERGITLCKKYPFIGSRGKCRAMNTNPYTINHIYKIKESGGANEIRAMLKNGPVASEFVVTPKLMHYKKGIFEDEDCGVKENHAISTIGFDYDSGNGTYYYVLRNSWGPYWGENGNFRFKYYPNSCALAKKAYFISVSNAGPGCCS